ncbi:hypothetical protein [Streptantibioticus silvisoli]|uniref:ATP-binding cassette domain-containing protein n=1 Tax=Streptantibioticus silvisoli TaxID=2705255 RepID=A0ABT6VRR6_9ACTN|nr:hypothetical protein [Streptantibioticus silvisoli]MDI5961177.1 hypothetical protein [Streptantibioticus silvisoli]
MDLAELDRPTFRKQIGYVDKNAHLFGGSIRENIMFGADSGAEKAELIDAVRFARVHATGSSSARASTAPWSAVRWPGRCWTTWPPACCPARPGNGYDPAPSGPPPGRHHPTPPGAAVSDNELNHVLAAAEVFGREATAP